MKCNRCGAELPENANICFYCGTPVSNAEAGNGSYNAPQNENIEYNQAAPKKQGKGKKVVRTIALLVALVMLAGAVVLAVSGVFFGVSVGGPLGEIGGAMQNTLEDGFNMEFEFTVNEDGDSDSYKCDICVAGIDEDTEKLGGIVVQEENGTVYYIDEEYTYLNRGNHGSLNRIELEDEAENGSMAAVIMEDIERLADDFDIEEIAKMINCTAGYRMLDEAAFSDKVKDILSDFSDEEFLEENFGYSEKTKGDKTTYSFEFDAIELFDLAYDIIEESPEVFVWETDHEIVLDELDEFINDLEEDDISVDIALDIVVTGEYITDISGELMYAYTTSSGNRRQYSYKVSCELSDFGEAEIDSDILDDVEHRKDQLGNKSDTLYWNSNEVYYYDEEYEIVYIEREIKDE